MERTPIDLKQWMTANRYSVRTLAAALSVQPSTVQRWRNDGEVPTLAYLALKGLEAGE